jgi:uncharacterized protein (TIGR02001 family)
MRIMKKLLSAAALTAAATAAMTGAAAAEGSFSGNVALTSDYVFRGISQSDSEIAIQGGFDYANELGSLPIYAGAWASSIDFGLDGTVEVDVYGGIRPKLGPVTFDVGVIGYLYPGMDDFFEADMVEFKAGASIAPAEGLTLGLTAYYSPDFTFTVGSDEDAVYVEGAAAYTISDIFSVSGAVGNQSVDLANYYGAAGDSYTTWNVGGTISKWGFGLDLRYFDTDLDPSLVGPSGDEVSDGRFVATLKRAL